MDIRPGIWGVEFRICALLEEPCDSLVYKLKVVQSIDPSRKKGRHNNDVVAQHVVGEASEE